MPAHKESSRRRRARAAEHAPGRDLFDREVREVMSTDVFSIRHETAITDAARRLVEAKVHGAPVIDANGRLVGLVSQTDLLAWYAERLPAAPASRQRPAGSVRDVMTPYAHAVRPNTRVSTAAALMIRRHIHRLMVVDRDLAPVGIVSAFDLLHTVPGAGEHLRALPTPE